MYDLSDCQQEIIPHPDYSVHYNDIALIRLTGPIQFTDDIRPACLRSDLMDVPWYQHLSVSTLGRLSKFGWNGIDWDLKSNRE